MLGASPHRHTLVFLLTLHTSTWPRVRQWYTEFPSPACAEGSEGYDPARCVQCTSARDAVRCFLMGCPFEIVDAVSTYVKEFHPDSVPGSYRAMVDSVFFDIRKTDVFSCVKELLPSVVCDSCRPWPAEKHLGPELATVLVLSAPDSVWGALCASVRQDLKELTEKNVTKLLRQEIDGLQFQIKQNLDAEAQNMLACSSHDGSHRCVPD